MRRRYWRTPSPVPGHILTVSCVNRPGIVAKVSAAWFGAIANVLEDRALLNHGKTVVFEG
jgi:formyltetrahydrofolate hydrolase